MVSGEGVVVVELLMYIVGVYNVVAPQHVTNDECTSVMAEVIGVPRLLPNVPSFIMKTAVSMIVDWGVWTLISIIEDGRNG